MGAKADKLVTPGIVPFGGHWLENVLHRVGYFVLKVPPFSEIPLKSVLFHGVLQQQGVLRGDFLHVGIVPVGLAGKIVKGRGHFQLVS